MSLTICNDSLQREVNANRQITKQKKDSWMVLERAMPPLLHAWSLPMVARRFSPEREQFADPWEPRLIFPASLLSDLTTEAEDGN